MGISRKSRSSKILTITIRRTARGKNPEIKIPRDIHSLMMYLSDTLKIKVASEASDIEISRAINVRLEKDFSGKTVLGCHKTKNEKQETKPSNSRSTSISTVSYHTIIEFLGQNQHLVPPVEKTHPRDLWEFHQKDDTQDDTQKESNSDNTCTQNREKINENTEYNQLPLNYAEPQITIDSNALDFY